jgi:hypothetical protein
LKALKDVDVIRVPNVKGTGPLPAFFNGQPGNSFAFFFLLRDLSTAHVLFVGAYIVLEHIYMRDIASSPTDQVSKNNCIKPL